MKKRILSMLMILCMLVSLFPVGIAADDALQAEASEAEQAADTLLPEEEFPQDGVLTGEAPSEEADEASGISEPEEPAEEDGSPLDEGQPEELGEKDTEESTGEPTPETDEDTDDLIEAADALGETADPEDESPVEAMTASGTCGDGLTWTLADNGCLTITGTGPMTDYVLYTTATGKPDSYYYITTPWWEQRSQITSVVIDEGVTAIGDFAFRECRNLTNAVIPEGVTRIGDQAFHLCVQLTELTIPNSVVIIGELAFKSCIGLTTLDLPRELVSIGSSAFEKCSSVTTVSIPASLASVGKDAFLGCSRVKTLYVEDLAAYLSIPEQNSAYDGQFPLNSASNVKLYIAGTLAETIVIPEGVTAVHPHAFKGCTGITAVSIASSVSRLGYGAFQGCSSLTDIEIPDGVKIVGSYLCYGCASLTDAVIPNSVMAIGEYAFYNCRSLDHITIPPSVTSIGSSAFCSCSRLSDVEIPEGVTTIKSQSFKNCIGLTRVVIPSSVTVIESAAFNNCPNLKSICYTGTLEQWNAIQIGIYNESFSVAELITGYHIHQPEIRDKKEATCTEDGYSGDEVCAICGELFRKGETIPAPGHAVELTGQREPTENEEGYSGDRVCRRCGEVFERGKTIPKLLPDSLQLPKELVLKQEYVLLSMTTGETVIQDDLENEALSACIIWTTESGTDQVVSVTDGRVTAKSPGTDYVVATLVSGEDSVSARCRIDVLDENWQSVNDYTVTLPVTRVTTEIYSKNYAEIPVVIGLAQNQVTGASAANADDADAESNAVPKKEPDAGVMITGAVFDDTATKTAFTLRIKDDRTLQVIPAFDLKNPKAVGGSYKSTITLTLADGTELPTPQISLTVKKSIPKLKATPVKLNRFVKDDSVEVVVTGGTIESFTANKLDFATLSDDPDHLTVTVNNSYGKNGSGRFTLKCTLKDWTLPAILTIPVSVTYKAPKVVLKPASLTLNPSAPTPDVGSTLVTVTPLPGMEHTITVKTGDSGLAVDPITEDGVIKVSLGNATSGTYKLPVQADGFTVAILTVKVLAGTPASSISAKAAGAIDTEIPNSPVKIIVTGKNYNASAGEYKLKITQTKKDSPETVVLDESNDTDVGLFVVTHKANILTVTGTDKLKGFVSGYTYTATVTSEIGAAKAVRLTVKTTTAKKPAYTTTLKAKGSIDVLRPGGEIRITPTFKNWYGYDLSKAKLNLEDELFDWELEDGVFIVTAKDGANINAKATHTVSMTLDGKTTDAVKLSVKMGMAKVAQNVKAVTLSRTDRYDRQSVILSLSDPALYDLDAADVVLSDKNGKFELTSLGAGEYAIGYKESLLPSDINKIKSTQVQLYVYLCGNGSHTFNHTINGTQNAVIPVKIDLAGTYVKPKDAPEEKVGKTVLKCAFNQTITNPEARTLLKISDDLYDATEGRYSIEVYPDAALGDQAQNIENVMIGALDMALVGNSIIELYSADFSIIATPYIYDSIEHQEKVFESNGPALQALYATTEVHGFSILSTYCLGARNLYTRDGPVTNPNELKGLKIRVMGSDTCINMMNAMGGIGTPMAQGDVYTAIQNKTLDGAENNIITYVDLVQYEVAPYYNYTGHLLLPDELVISTDVLESMSEEDQAALRKVCKESMTYCYNLCEELRAEYQAKAERMGAIFSEADIPAFQALCQDLILESAQKSNVTQNMYNLIMSLR